MNVTYTKRALKDAKKPTKLLYSSGMWTFHSRNNYSYPKYCAEVGDMREEKSHTGLYVGIVVAILLVIGAAIVVYYR